MDETMIRFWGVRGSIPSPGGETARVGGNTSCVEVRMGGKVFVLDLGTGARALGERLVAEGAQTVRVLLSHVHWDHIQGLPFFGPAWRRGTRVAIEGAASTATPELDLRASLALQMRDPHFPVGLEAMGSDLSVVTRTPGESWPDGDVRVRTLPVHHPGGSTAYRLEHDGVAVVYATDLEHGFGHDEALVAFARAADVLVYDAMYTDAELRGDAGPSRRGWGHSTWQEACRVADAAGVGRLVLFHHDPRRSDPEVEAIEVAAQQRRPGTVAAREGMTWLLGHRLASVA